MRNGPCLDDVFAGTNVIAGVTVDQQVVALDKGQQKKNEKEDNVSQGGNEIVFRPL